MKTDRAAIRAARSVSVFRLSTGRSEKPLKRRREGGPPLERGFTEFGQAACRSAEAEERCLQV